jgi:hypothetical protein
MALRPTFPEETSALSLAGSHVHARGLPNSKPQIAQGMGIERVNVNESLEITTNIDDPRGRTALYFINLKTRYIPAAQAGQMGVR